MPDDDAEAQRIASRERIRQVVEPIIQDSRLAHHDRLDINLREDKDLARYKAGLAWAMRGAERSATLGKRLLGWMAGLATLVGLLAGLIDIYLKLRGVEK